MLPSRRAWRLPTLSRLHVDHHNLGRYSLEKLRHFQEYQRTTSPTRVAAVLVLTPLFTLLLITAMDVVRLNDPRAGPSLNTVAFVRSTISHAVMTFFTLLPLKQALTLSHHDYSFRTITLIACCTSLTIESVCITLAFTWKSPVPFREMIGLPIFLVSICVYNFTFATGTMRRLWRRRKLQAYVPLVGVQIAIFYTLLALSVGCSYLAETPQIVMTALFPLVRVLLKHLVWKYVRFLDDISTDVTVCMVEISGALYQTVSMQFVKSVELNVLIVVVDCAIAIHDIHTFVRMDYLGQSQHTLDTALKIVDSYLQDVASRRVTRYAVLTQSGATECATGRETSVPAGRRHSGQMASEMSQWRPSQQGRRRSSMETMLPIAHERAATNATQTGPPFDALDLETQVSEGRDSEHDGSAICKPPIQASPQQSREAPIDRPRRSSLATLAALPYVTKPSRVEVSDQSRRPVGAGLQLKSAYVRPKLLRSLSAILSSARISVHPDTHEFHDLKPGDGTLDAAAAALNHTPREGSLQTSLEAVSSSTILPPRRNRRRVSTSTTINGVCISRQEQVLILEKTLRLLFSSELLIFIEYIEFVIPILYAMTLGCEWLLPNAPYNLIVRNMTSTSVMMHINNSLLYALLELLAMVVIYWVMRRKYGVPALYQLAFVLERYWMTLQGKLVGSFIVVLNAVTVHQGTDFSFLQGP